VHPSSYIADARAVFTKRYGPQPRRQREQKHSHIPDDAKGETEASSLRDSEKRSYISPSMFTTLVWGFAAVVAVAALLYISFVIQDYRFYEQGEGGVYELRSQELDLF
jgi:hypothetical protein